MKTIKLTILTALSVLSTLSCILLSGCNTIKAVPLAYTENEDKEVAYVYFDLYRKSEISGATFITYDNKNTPKAEKFTYYSPVELPAGVPIKMYLHVQYKEPRSNFGDKDCVLACCTTIVNSMEAQRDVDKDIVFNIPKLEPFVEYTISYRKGAGIPGSSFVTLTRTDTKEVIREIEFN
ncbi:MAG: hypothetical protein J5710_15745 [Treponema sp.]|nr:hypothetical protein [Treponema sp.]